MKKIILKVISVVMALVLLVQAQPLHGFVIEVHARRGQAIVVPAAAAPPVADDENHVAIPIAEIESLRTADTRHFLNDDGTYTAMVYPQPIHFQDEHGNWVSIDNTLVSNGDFYSPRASGTDIQLPKELGGDNRITLNVGGFGVAIGVPQTAQPRLQLPTPPLPETTTEPTTETEIETTTAPAEATTEPETTTQAYTIHEATTTYNATTEYTEIEVELEPYLTYDEPQPVQASHVVSRAYVLDLSEFMPQLDNLTHVDNLSSSIIYLDAFPGADLLYIVSPGQLKEFVIVNQPKAEYVYNFTLDLENLIAIQEDERTIRLHCSRTGDLQMRIEAPFAFDSAGVVNEEALTLMLEGNILTLTACSDWMNEPEREFPVFLDPVYIYQLPYLEMRTATVSERGWRPNNWFWQLRVGRSTNWLRNTSRYRSMIRFPLPELPSSAVVNDARLLMFHTELSAWFSVFDLPRIPFRTGVPVPEDFNFIDVGAHMITNHWPRGHVSWNNQPSFDSRVLGTGRWIGEVPEFLTPCPDGGDEATIIDGLEGGVVFDITDAMKQWIEHGEENNGIMLRALDEDNLNNELVTFTSLRLPELNLPIPIPVRTHRYCDDYPSCHEDCRGTWRIATIPVAFAINPDSNQPFVFLTYVNNVGLSAQWTFETIDIGASGNAFINHYNGGLSFVYPTVSLTGERMPFTLAHTYVSSRELPSRPGVNPNFVGRHAGMNFGIGFRLNVVEEIFRQGTVWTLVDGTGAHHNFFRVSEGNAFPRRYVKMTDPSVYLILSNNNNAVIEDARGNQRVFRNSRNIGTSWGSADHFVMTEIRDTNGNRVQINYDSATGRIMSIYDAVDRVIQLRYHGNGLLHYIECPAGRTTTFSYEQIESGISDDVWYVLTEIEHSDGTYTVLGYDRFAERHPVTELRTHLTAIQNSQSQLVQFVYERTGTLDRPAYRVIEVIQGAGQLGEAERPEYNPETLPWWSNWAGWLVDAIRWVRILVFYLVWNVVGQPPNWWYDEWGRWFRDRDHVVGDVVRQRFEFDDSVHRVSTEFQRSIAQTVITSSATEEVITLLFDRMGHTVNISNNFGEIFSTGFTSAGNVSNVAHGQIVRNFVHNASNEILNVSGQPSNDGWTATGQVSHTIDSVVGGFAWSLPEGASIQQAISSLNPGTYTLSAFVRGGEVRLRHNFNTNDRSYMVTAANNSWDRFSFTFDVQAGLLGGTQASGNIFIEALGGAVVDAIQLEKSSNANPFNLVENSSFSSGDNRWTFHHNSSQRVVSPRVTNGVLQVEGVGLDYNMSVQQVIPLYARTGQMITFGAQVEGNAIRGGFRGTYDDRIINDDFALMAEFLFAFTGENGVLGDFETVGEPVVVDFQRDITGRPQIAMQSHALRQDATHMRLHIIYNGQPQGVGNALRIHDAFVFVGGSGTEHEYDDAGRLLRTRNAGGVVEYQYDRFNNVTQVTVRRMDGRVEIMRLDYYPVTHNLQQVRQYIVEEGQERLLSTTTYAYYGLGGVLRSITIEEDGVTSVQTITYTNNNNDVATIQNAAGQTASFVYESRYNNIITRATGFDGVANAFVYDERGLLSRIENEHGIGGRNREIQYTFGDDRLGRITHNNTNYVFEHNAIGQLVQSSIAGQAIITNTFDDDGRLRRTQFAGGTLGRYEPTFDDRGRLIAERYFGADNRQQAHFDFRWGDNGQLTRARTLRAENDAERTSQFDYDLAGRLTGVDTADTNPNRQVDTTRVRMAYDVNGALNRLGVWADGSLLSDTHYFLDDQARPHRSEFFTLHAQQSYEFVAMNRLSRTTLQLPDGEVIMQLAYRTHEGNATDVIENMTTTLPDGTRFAFDYRYDQHGRIVAIYENGRDNPPTHTFEYDAIGQLVRHNDTVFTYDNYGNILSAIGGGRNDEFTYRTNGWQDQLTHFNGQEITYDALGNMTSFAGRTYSWERGGLLSEISIIVDEHITETWVSEEGDTYSEDIHIFYESLIKYEYDHNGLRVRRIVDGRVTDYIWAGNMLMARICDRYEIVWSYDATGRMVGFTLNGAPYFYIRNLFGDVVAIIDIDGQVVARYEYDAWGNIVNIEDTSLSGVGHINPIRYRGYYWDAYAGFYYLLSRWYNPQWGRFISADIYFDTGHGVLGANMYAYALNNPIMYWDPLGTNPFAIFDFILASVDFLLAVGQIFINVVMLPGIRLLIRGLTTLLEVLQTVQHIVESYVIPFAETALQVLTWMRTAQPAPVNRRFNTVHNAFFDMSIGFFTTVLAVSRVIVIATRILIPVVEVTINALQIVHDLLDFFANVIIAGWRDTIAGWRSAFNDFYIAFDPDPVGVGVLGATDARSIVPMSNEIVATEQRPGHVNLFLNESRQLRARFTEGQHGVFNAVTWNITGSGATLTGEAGNTNTVRANAEGTSIVTARLERRQIGENSQISDPIRIYVTVSSQQLPTFEVWANASTEAFNRAHNGTFNNIITVGQRTVVRGISGNFFRIVSGTIASGIHVGYVPIGMMRPEVTMLPANERRRVRTTGATTTLRSWPSVESRFTVPDNLSTETLVANSLVTVIGVGIGEQDGYYFVETDLRGANRFMFVRRNAVGSLPSVNCPPIADITRGTAFQYMQMNIGWPLGVRVSDGVYQEARNLNRISSPFGLRFYHSNRTSDLHLGADFNRAPSGNVEGVPVLAVTDGLIVYRNNGGGSAGFTISILSTDPSHVDPVTGQALLFTYMHMRSEGRADGTVRRGDKIGYASNTGAQLTSNGHLHFEVSNFRAAYPTPWLPWVSGLCGNASRHNRIRYRINPIFFFPSGTFSNSNALEPPWNERRPALTCSYVSGRPDLSCSDNNCATRIS